MKPTPVIIAALLIVYMGLGVLNPLLAPMVRELGLSEVQGGLLITAASLMFTIGSPFWGGRIALWGYKRVLLLSLCGFGMAYGIFAFVLGLGVERAITPLAAFLGLMVVRGLAGFLMSGTPVTAQAYIVSVTSGPERTSGIALLGIANGMGFIAGPILGALLVSFGLVAPIVAAAVLPLIAAVLIATQLRDPSKRQEVNLVQPRLSPIDGRILPWLMVGFTVIAAMVGVQVTAGFLFQDRLGLTSQETAMAVSTALVAVGITNLISQLGIIRMLRVPPLQLLRVGLPLAAVGFASLAVAATFPLLIASFVLAGFGLGLALPGYTAAATLEVQAHEQGRAAGLTTAAQGLGSVFGPLLATSLYQLRQELPYLLAFTLLGLVSLAVWLHPRLRRVAVLAARPVASD
jgi:MFS family permease